jgi:gamma-glutamylcyclotransferase (GGCT)/AIG2-like uncharacterized protein YtfP
MADLSLAEATRLISAANALRWRGDASSIAHAPDAAEAERQLDARFGTGQTLAVYGSLAPGRSNHHVVAPLGGQWAEGVVEGDLHPVGWGATLGFPAFRPREGGPAVPVHVLTSAALPAAWNDLDLFEGAEYRRILVPVLKASAAGAPELYTVANLYAAAAEIR